MNEVKDIKLKEIGCSFISGYAFKSKDYSENGISLIKIGNIQNKTVQLTEKDNYISSELITSKLKKYRIDSDDILIAMTGQGSVGRIGKVRLPKNEYAILNQRVGKFICDEENINREYLYYILASDIYQDYLFNTGSGSGQPNLHPDLILETEIPYFKYKEQKAIAEVLSSLDDKIDLLHRQNKTLEELAQTLFRQWFIEEAKDEWEEKPLSKIANFLNGLACQKFPPTNDVDKLPVLKIKDLKGGISDSSDWATTDITPEYIIESGDIIFAWSASLIVKIWDGEKCILNQHLFKVTSDDYPKWFYYQWCKYHLDRFVAIAQAHATTMGHIKRKDLDNAMCFVPSDDEMEVMDEQMVPLMEKMENNSKQIKTLENMRDTLLPKLMSGEVRVGI